MIHLRKGRKLKRTSSHKKALMRSLASALFEHKRIETTLAKAKELRPYAENLITKAKHAMAREKQGLLPEGQTIDIHNRRIVSKHLTSKGVLEELFDTIAPKVEERPGGYTRIIKTGFRRGDAGAKAIIELVDWAAPQDGTVSLKTKTKKKQKPAAAAPKVIHTEKTAAAVEEVKAFEAEAIEAEAVEAVDTVEEQVLVEETPIAEVTAEEAPASEAPVEDVPAAESTEEPKDDNKEVS
jgi:large subunit ribosomal protein L17